MQTVSLIIIIIDKGNKTFESLILYKHNLYNNH